MGIISDAVCPTTTKLHEPQLQKYLANCFLVLIACQLTGHVFTLCTEAYI